MQNKRKKAKKPTHVLQNEENIKLGDLKRGDEDRCSGLMLD